MPFDFVNGLVDGKRTNLDNKWLKDVKKTLKQAQSISVKDVVFVRTIMKDDTTGTESNMFNNNKDHIYQVTMDNDAQSTFYVNSVLIMDIIGEEVRVDEGGIELHLQHCIWKESVTQMGIEEEIKQ